jgi:hypothetical protein
METPSPRRESLRIRLDGDEFRYLLSAAEERLRTGADLQPREQYLNVF